MSCSPLNEVCEGGSTQIIDTKIFQVQNLQKSNVLFALAMTGVAMGVGLSGTILYRGPIVQLEPTFSPLYLFAQNQFLQRGDLE